MHQRPRLEKQRLDILVDGVYAIALTLLVLDVKLPDGLAAAEVPRHLVALLPKLGAYAIAFATVALMWLCHYYVATLVRQSDYTHIVLNLAPLMLVALVPFSAATVGTYPGSAWAAALFAANFASITLLYALNWQHCRRYLIGPRVDPRTAHHLTQLIWAFFAVECLATVLALAVPSLGLALVALLVPLGYAFAGLWEGRMFEPCAPSSG